MDARRGALVLAAGRLALGVAVLAAPERVTAAWLGDEHARRPVVRYLARSLGARDLALGLAALQTIDDPLLAPRIQAACATADSADALATIIARADLPRRGAIATVVVAAAAAAAGLHFSRELARA